jgi:hypothetical protein
MSVDEALSRWGAGMQDLSRMAIVVAWAALDDLLGASIKPLLATGTTRQHHENIYITNNQAA